MKKLTRKLVELVLPTATAKASPVQAKCISGCGGDGIYVSGRTPSGKVPCC